MSDKKSKIAPEHTAVRTSLWRAAHVHLDSAPHILNDTIGEKIIAEAEWMQRPDMHPVGTRRIRASIVARARLIEDLIVENFKNNIFQYVILGAGLDTFALRNPELLKSLRVFEIDQPGPQAWKVNRINDLKIEIPKNLKFVPVDFENKEDWIKQLVEYGFDKKLPAVIVSTGVTMYLSREANIETLKNLKMFVSGSIFATTFMLPPELLPNEDRMLLEFSMKKAAEAGTPFISLFQPNELIELAKEAGIDNIKTVTSEEIHKKYFDNRADKLEPAVGEYFLIAKL